MTPIDVQSLIAYTTIANSPQGQRVVELLSDKGLAVTTEVVALMAQVHEMGLNAARRSLKDPSLPADAAIIPDPSGVFAGVIANIKAEASKAVEPAARPAPMVRPTVRRVPSQNAKAVVPGGESQLAFLLRKLNAAGGTAKLSDFQGEFKKIWPKVPMSGPVYTLAKKLYAERVSDGTHRILPRGIKVLDKANQKSPAADSPTSDVDRKPSQAEIVLAAARGNGGKITSQQAGQALQAHGIKTRTSPLMQRMVNDKKLRRVSEGMFEVA